MPEPPPKPENNVQAPFIGPVAPPIAGSSNNNYGSGFTSNSIMSAEELKEAKKKINDLLAPCKAFTATQTVNDSVISD